MVKGIEEGPDKPGCKTAVFCDGREFPILEAERGNGHKLSAQRFLGQFVWTSVTYDWLMVALDTIEPIVLKACTHCP